MRVTNPLNITQYRIPTLESVAIQRKQDNPMDNNNIKVTGNDDPLMDFSNCHVGIIKNFEQLRGLATTNISEPISPDIKQTAAKLYSFFHEVVLKHHKEEEDELFNVVLDCARRGEETLKSKTMIKQLTNEHRMLELQWKLIEPDIKQLAKGKFVIFDQAMALRLANSYLDHAQFEEREFLPLSAEILGDKGLSSLGLSIHMRHTQVGVANYM
jgi:hemerythrin-like domain-containing protein